MEPIALLGLAAMLFVKEAGVPIPVPGDLLVLGAGVAAAGSGTAGLVVLPLILVAGYLGGTLQFVLVRGTLRRRVLAVLGRVGVPLDRVDDLAAQLRRRGAAGVAIARATPGVRIASIAASGLAAVPLPSFVAGLVVGNTVFVGGHFALGFAVGAPALALASSLGGLAVGALALLALAVVGGVGWRLIRQRRSRPSPRALGGWLEAACPACLALELPRSAPTR